MTVQVMQSNSMTKTTLSDNHGDLASMALTNDPYRWSFFSGSSRWPFQVIMQVVIYTIVLSKYGGRGGGVLCLQHCAAAGSFQCSHQGGPVFLQSSVWGSHALLVLSQVQHLQLLEMLLWVFSFMITLQLPFHGSCKYSFCRCSSQHTHMVMVTSGVVSTHQPLRCFPGDLPHALPATQQHDLSHKSELTKVATLATKLNLF